MGEHPKLCNGPAAAAVTGVLIFSRQCYHMSILVSTSSSLNLKDKVTEPGLAQDHLKGGSK